MIKIKGSLVALLLLFSSSIFAEDLDFGVIGLFKNKAMIEHDGIRKMLRVDQEYKGVKLISSDSRKAKFLINGEIISLGLHDSKIGKVFSDNPNAEKKFVRIPRDNTGMFRTTGFINGIQVRFLVDTGASQVAMNERVARQVGLQYRLKGKQVAVSTAAGRSSAWALKLNKVNVGGVELKQVDAMVLKGPGPDEVLLGMSFLKQLQMQDEGELLRLTKKL